MANTIFSSEGALLFIMVAMVALGFWLQRFKAFKTLGPALTVIIMGIVLSNLRIVPTSSATYDAVSSYCVPLSISICLLSLDLKQMRKLSKEPIIALASAIFSVCVAALVFGILFANKIDEGWKVAGMFVGTYTGGSSNLTAIAVGLDASKTTIASANAADYVRERIWATNQQIEDCEDGGLILTLTTRSEPELRAWVRSFGDAAVLLEDDTPREQG